MTTPTPPAQAAASNYVSGSLYVGDLPKGATEGQLFDVFRNVGPVASIRVCRDAVTKESLGYAYVNFHNNADAERAIEQLNFTPILGKPCRIMWSQRDPAKRKSGTGNIFIKNLDKSINNAALYDTFSAFGHILSCKVEVDDNGVSKGYGFVHYETQDEADKAVARVNGMLVAGKIVFVGPFLPKKARGTDAPPAVFTNVYVKNLDESVNQEKLQEMFEKHGKVTSCAVMQNEKGESKGFGFVNFEKAEEAQAAVDALNNTVINGKQMYAGRAQKKQERAEELRQKRSEQVQKFQGANVYVKNLDDNVNDEKLKQEFSRFGAITSAKVMTDDKGNSKGFGFILFSNPEDATRAITEMNGVIFGTKPLYASLAQRKDVRQAQLAVLHQQKVNMMQMNLMNNMRGPGMMFPGPQFGYPPMGGMPPRMPFPPQMMQRGGQPRFGPGGPQGAGPQPNGAPQGNGVPQGGRGGPGGFQVGGDVGQRGGNNRPRNPRPPPAQPANGKGRGQGGQNQNAQGQLNKNYKYTSTARNQPAAGNAPANPPPQEPENENEAKQQAGEQLYTLIFGKAHPMLAGKITGMLLESHNIGELHEIIRTASLLDSKVAEALAVLQAHQPEGEAAAPISV